jgi:hypothetical protein
MYDNSVASKRRTDFCNDFNIHLLVAQNFHIPCMPGAHIEVGYSFHRFLAVALIVSSKERFSYSLQESIRSRDRLIASVSVVVVPFIYRGRTTSEAGKRALNARRSEVLPASCQFREGTRDV